MPGESEKPGGWALAVEVAAYFSGAVLGLVFLSSMFPALVVPIAAGALAPLHLARRLVHDRRLGLRVLGVFGWIATICVHLLVLYLALAWGGALAWAVRPWGWALVAALAVSVAVTAVRPWRGVRVAPLLPLGAFVALALLGWRTEETIVRCDDYLELARERAVEVIVPTARRLERCAAGDEIAIGRYPRVVWEAPHAARLVVTTQAARGSTERSTHRFTGSVCEVREGRAPVCVGEGRAQGFAEAPALDRLFVASWGRMRPGVRGELLVLPRTGDFELLDRVEIEGSYAELFYDARADRIYGFTDEGFEMIPIVASTLAREPSVAIPFLPPGSVRYDVERGEGILCAAGSVFLDLDGSRFSSIAVRGEPFELRPLGGASALTPVMATWGCDWDPIAREAYVAAPNLGLLVHVDYDSGEVLRSDFVGFGMRSVTIDRARDRLYLTDFLGGAVIAIDRRSGRELAHWRVGRFPRFTTLARDGGSLYVGTNAGVVQISLSGRTPRPDRAAR